MTWGSVVNNRFNIIRTSKRWEQIIKFLDKLLKTSQKGSLHLQKVEKWTRVAYTELKADRSNPVKIQKQWNEENDYSCSYTQTKLNTFKKEFLPRQDNKFKKFSVKTLA